MSNEINYLPHEQFIRSLQSQIAYGARKVLALEQEIDYLKQVRLTMLEQRGIKDYAWVQTSDTIDTLKKTVKRLAQFQKDNKQLLKYLVDRQREILDLRKSEEHLMWMVTNV